MMPPPSNNTGPAIRAYRKLASRYDRRWSFYIDASLRETLARIDLRPAESLLDVGCGTGVLLKSLSASVPNAKLAGSDPSPEMLEIARGRLSKEVILKQCGAEALAFPDESLDVVVCTSAFHYFRHPEAALGEMARVLRPRGRLVITDWCDDYITCRVFDLFLRLFDRAHMRAYGQEECCRLVQRAGFAAVRIDRYRINWFWGLMTAVGERDTGLHPI